MVEVGPGHGTLAEQAVGRGLALHRHRSQPDPDRRPARQGPEACIESWAPPIPVPDGSADVVYADQVLEHMNGIDAARQFTAEALRALRPGGVFFVVVPDYLKERTFFWDVDYTHNFVTTERRVRQLFNDGGFEVLQVERSIGVATGVARDALAAAAPAGQHPRRRHAVALHRHDELLFKIRKNLFETLTFVARKPAETDSRRCWRGWSASWWTRARGHRGDPGLARHAHRHGRRGARGRLDVAAAPGGGAGAGRGRSRRDDLALDPAAARQRRADGPPRRRRASSWSARSSAASCPPASAATPRAPTSLAQITSRSAAKRSPRWSSTGCSACCRWRRWAWPACWPGRRPAPESAGSLAAVAVLIAACVAAFWADRGDPRGGPRPRHSGA